MSFPALRTNAPAPRSDLSSNLSSKLSSNLSSNLSSGFSSDDNATKADDSKAIAPARTRNEARISTLRVPSVVVPLEPHWETSIDSATD
jgi:hypothetical protein